MKRNFTAKIANLTLNTVLISMLILKSQELLMKLVTNGAVEYEVVDMEEVRGSKPCIAVSFCMKSGYCGEKNFFPLKTANLHRYRR